MSSICAAGTPTRFEQGLHQVGRQVVGADVAVDALLGMGAADGRANGFDDDGMTHGGSSMNPL